MANRPGIFHIQISHCSFSHLPVSRVVAYNVLSVISETWCNQIQRYDRGSHMCGALFDMVENTLLQWMDRYCCRITDEWRRFGWTSTRNIYTNDVHTIAASTLATSQISWRFAPNSTASLLAGLWNTSRLISPRNIRQSSRPSPPRERYLMRFLLLKAAGSLV